MEIKTGGDCFATANELALRLSSEGVNGVLVVHGLVMHPTGNFRHIHAWVQVKDMVFDYEHRVGFVTSRRRYYRLGKIEPMGTRAYSIGEVAMNMVLERHHGPWDMELIRKEEIPEEFEISCNRPRAE
jgi:hypothetical protein